MGRFSIQVDCYCGYRGEQEPRRLRFGMRTLAVAEILDRWLGPDHRYFKLLGEDGNSYILRHDVQSHEWSLVRYRRATGAPHGGPAQAGISSLKCEANA